MVGGSSGALYHRGREYSSSKGTSLFSVWFSIIIPTVASHDPAQIGSPLDLTSPGFTFPSKSRWERCSAFDPGCNWWGAYQRLRRTKLHLADCRESRDIVDTLPSVRGRLRRLSVRCLTAVFWRQSLKSIERKLFRASSLRPKSGRKNLSELLRVEIKLTQRNLRLLPGVEAWQMHLPHLDDQR